MASSIIAATGDISFYQIAFFVNGKSNPVNTYVIGYKVYDDGAIEPIYFPKIPKGAIAVQKDNSGRYTKFDPSTWERGEKSLTFDEIIGGL